MEIIIKKVEELVPYENNPRKNDNAVEFVANSIREFGFKVPIIIDENNIIITGHTRLKAALKLGLKEVPCIIASDLNEEQVNAFRLVDNKVSENALWDYEKLVEELKSINIDMSLFDFNDQNIDFNYGVEEEEAAPQEAKDFMYECPKCHKLIEKDEIEWF